MQDGATLVVVPVLGRPHRVAPLLDSIAGATDGPYRVQFVATSSDEPEIEALQIAGADYFTMPPAPFGDWAKKINEATRRSTEPFVFTGADDLKFHPHWLERALAKMDDETIGVVGTNDLGNDRVRRGEHSTHSLVRRTYVEKFGTIDEPGLMLHEGYWHEYVDDELVWTAKSRGAFAAARDSIVEHLHPNWGKAETDNLYSMQQRRMRQGRRLFNQRRPLMERQWVS